MNNILEIRGLVTSFAMDGRKDRAVAVNGVDIDIPRGAIVGLVGESGCGKSVTAFSTLGLLSENGRVDAGSAMFGGQDLLKLKDHELRRIRGNRISMIFQEPMTSLNPIMTVGREIGGRSADGAMMAADQRIHIAARRRGQVDRKGPGRRNPRKGGHPRSEAALRQLSP